VGKRDFSLEEEPDFQPYLGKKPEIELKKKKFSTESKGRHQNFKRSEIITYMREDTLPQHLAIDAKV